ncbi:MAG: CoA pyrophosphatase [Chloroflexota bacterium]
MNISEADITGYLATALDPTLPPESPYPAELLDGEPRPVAVLIPLLRQEGEWNVLFIRRTVNEHDRHGGQVAFPRGRCDPGDPDAETAALREAFEETGIEPADVRVLGRLRDILTISNYRVTPVVGVIPWPYALRPQSEEVSWIFTIPLKWLADPANRKVQKRSWLHLGNPVPMIYFAPYDGETLWGASARMTLLLLESLGLSLPGDRYSGGGKCNP